MTNPESKKEELPMKEESKGTILIVDDDNGIRNLLDVFWKRKGFTTVTAQNGFEALRKLEEVTPAIILLDVTMPGMDGILTLKRIKQKNPDMGVVMITGLQDQDIAEEAMTLGAYSYVTKPFDLNYLELVVLTRLMMAR